MKYVIKELNQTESNSYAVHHAELTGFHYTSELHNATQFASLADAVRALTARSAMFGTGPDFTIVGVKEVNMPKYEEVEL